MVSSFPLFILAAAVAASETAPPSGPVGDTGLYVGWGYLLFFYFCVAIWLYMTSWVANDAIGVGLRHPRWTTYMLAAGGIPLVLIMLTHVMVGILMLISVGTVFGVYVGARNQVVPVLYKLFTREHIDRVLVRLHLRKPLDQREFKTQAGRKIGRHIAIRVTNMDGVSLETLCEANATLGGALYDVAELLDRAVTARTVAVQFEPRPAEFAVRARVDGILHNFPSYDIETGRLMLGLVAFLAGITNADGKKVKDQGTFLVHPPDGEKVEVGVSTVKTAAGPTLAIKFPDPTIDLYKDGIEKLGIFKSMIQKHRELVQQSSEGLILIAGPSQSGKTTTFYATLAEIDVYVNTVVLIEEKEEHPLDQVTRATFDISKGERFDKTLERALREDPNVVAIGEIKDKHMAALACETAKEKLVIATIQAADAANAISKMRALGVPGEKLARVLVVVFAQRLVRLLCTECRVPFEPPPDLLLKLKVNPEKPGTWFEAGACPVCAQIGFRGRTGVYELMLMSPDLKKVIAQPSAPDEKIVRALARKSGMKNMQEDGIKKVTFGATSLKEVHRATALK